MPKYAFLAPVANSASPFKAFQMANMELSTRNWCASHVPIRVLLPFVFVYYFLIPHFLQGTTWFSIFVLIVTTQQGGLGWNIDHPMMSDMLWFWHSSPGFCFTHYTCTGFQSCCLWLVHFLKKSSQILGWSAIPDITAAACLVMQTLHDSPASISLAKDKAIIWGPLEMKKHYHENHKDNGAGALSAKVTEKRKPTKEKCRYISHLRAVHFVETKGEGEQLMTNHPSFISMGTMHA